MFIHHSNTSDVLEYLAEAILHRRIVPFLGQPGTGKSYLLEYLASIYWRKERGLQFETPRIVYAKIRESTAKAGGRYSTPMACITFTEITFGLTEISRQYDSELVHNTRIWYRKPQSQYTDLQFNSLFAFVRDECRRLAISGIIIDNAAYLDVYTVQRLMDMRRLLKGQLSLIFCARIEQKGAINETLSRVLNVAIDQDEIEHRVELASLAEKETRGAVLIKLLKHLNIDFDPHLQPKEIAAMRDMFWSETNGDWHAIAKRQRRLADTVGPNRGQRRFLTKEIFETVMGKPLPVIL